MAEHTSVDDVFADVLMHYGVPGMKWGRRKPGTGKPSSRKKGSGEKSADAAEAHDKKSQAKTKGVASLSNAELKKLNERLNLEQNYARMAKEKTKLDKGQDAVKVALGVVGTAASIYAAVNSPMFKAGKTLLDAQFSGALDAAIPDGTGAHRLVKEAVVTGARHRK